MSALRSFPCPAHLEFRIASGPEEFEAIHRLNHRTFAVEIPQHAPQPGGCLVDRFHEQNVYLTAWHGKELAGMVTMRFDRPFSLDQKTPEAMSTLPAGPRWCEIRLLAIAPAWRGTPVLAGLLRHLMTTVRARGFDAAVISATTRQLKLYQHLGFIPFGGLIGQEGARFQPMWITMETLARKVPWLDPPVSPEPVNLLPGPVAVAGRVQQAFHQPAVSHRSAAVLQQVQEIQTALRSLTGASQVALLSGGGTLANDVVAWQLRRLQSPGLVIDSGEFGRRLTDHAARAGLDFASLLLPADAPFGPGELDGLLAGRPEVRWLWLTHCETSSGRLFPVGELSAVCARRGVKCCVDGVSSLGVVPVDWAQVWLASAASGKGLAAYPGIALVFSQHPVERSPDLPRALDLGCYQETGGMPFTLGSNLIAALHAALARTDWPERFRHIRHHGRRLRTALSAAGFGTAAAWPDTSPAVITLTPPAGCSAAALADAAGEAGYQLAAHSPWLRQQNLLQVCLMGELQSWQTRALPALLAQLAASLTMPGKSLRGPVPADQLSA